jgi:hypothetical protein
MKNLLVIFILIGTFNFGKAQFSFESKKFITIYGEFEKVEEIDSEITIDSDTTEITVKFKNSTLRERIGKIYHRQITGIYKLYMYEQRRGEWVILHFDNDILSSVVFQSDTRYLVFE